MMIVKWTSFIIFACTTTLAGAHTQNDLLAEVFKSVDKIELVQNLKNTAFERYSATGKEKFRAYFIGFFQKIGCEINVLNFPSGHSEIEPEGHNVEAILKGESSDSVIVIVHYDSMGPGGDETSNPAVDDDMTGMAISFETARVISELVHSGKAKLNYTIRFVAADYEEWGGLAGARNYARYIKALAQSQNFKLIAAVDNEQSGWSCTDEQSCPEPQTIDVFSCSTNGNFDFPAQGDLYEQIAKNYSTLKVSRNCMGENSDHYAMWEIGIPTAVASEHNPFDNPHYDGKGGDTFEAINSNYFFKIAQVGVTYAAELAGLTPAGQGFDSIKKFAIAAGFSSGARWPTPSARE